MFSGSFVKPVEGMRDRWQVRPRTGASERKSWPIARAHVAVVFLLARLSERARPVPVQW
jgi:hypothetical protein